MAYCDSDSLRPTLTAGCDYVSDYCCDLCKQKENYVEATGYCSDCRKYLCSECFNNHLTSKPMRHHVLLDQHEMPKDQQQNRGGDTCTEACTEHPHKKLEYFCTQHDEFGCTLCMTLHHHDCKGVELITEVTSDILNNVEYMNFQEEIASLTQVTTTAIQASHDQIKHSKTNRDNALEVFKKVKKDISIAVDIIEQNLTKKADKIKEDDEKKMLFYEKKYNDVLADIQTVKSNFTSLQNNGQFCKMFIAMKRARREIDEIELRVGRPEHGIKARNYKLITSSEVQILLDTPQSMVKLEVMEECQQVSIPTKTGTLERQTYQNHKETYQSSVSSPKQKRTAAGWQGVALSVSQHNVLVTQGDAVRNLSKSRKKRAKHGMDIQDTSRDDSEPTNITNPKAEPHNRESMKTRVQHVPDIQVTYSDDNLTPYITGCIALPGDKLVVVDYQNDKVKLVDLTHNSVAAQLRLSGYLWDITKVNSTQVAVTSNNTQTIFVVNVSDQLELGRKIKVKGQCRGIACLKGKLLVSYDKPLKVEIIDMKGQLLQTVVREDKARELFTSPWYVAVSKDFQTFYISDYNIHTVTSVDVTGQVQATYKDGKLEEPRGLTVDSTGRVYVCGVASNNILQLTADLTEVQELIQRSDGLLEPRSVYYCETTDRLYIGKWGDALKVFQLK